MAKRASFGKGFSLLECLVASFIFGILSLFVLEYVQISELQFSESMNKYLAYIVARNQLQEWTSQGYEKISSFTSLDAPTGAGPLNNPCVPANGPCGAGTVSYNTAGALSDMGPAYNTQFTFSDGYHYDNWPTMDILELVINVTWNQPLALGGTRSQTISVSGYVHESP